MFVKPAEGLRIIDPFKKDCLPPEGREVPDTDFYWHRLKMDGDVIEVAPTQEPIPEVAQRKNKTAAPVPEADAS